MTTGSSAPDRRARSGAGAGIRPGGPALAASRVVHRRHHPTPHHFVQELTQIWIDPDRPEELFDRHPLWSSRRPAPVRFRRRDHLGRQGEPLGPAVRRALVQALDRNVDGPLRTLTQPRVWGWLFNPLTVHLAWDDAGADPVAALLEVTNTPWKERHLYAVALTGEGHQLTGRFAKRLHVSPFLDQHQIYALGLRGRSGGRTIDLRLDVHPLAGPRPDSRPPWRPPPGRPEQAGDLGQPVLETRLVSRLVDPDGPAMTAVLRPDRLPTHRVSLGIHRQAVALWRKRVPFVPHPGR